MSTTAQKIFVMEAFCKGEILQIKNYSSGGWIEFVGQEPLWDWVDFDYRIKPTPAELWAVLINGVCVGYPAYNCKEWAEKQANVIVTSESKRVALFREVIE